MDNFFQTNPIYVFPNAKIFRKNIQYFFDVLFCFKKACFFTLKKIDRYDCTNDLISFWLIVYCLSELQKNGRYT